jgi:hypothetical protein
MAGSSRRKLQVFVSSTYEDLKLERQAAIIAILTAGHIPAGTELFTAGDESLLAAIKRWIDESDIFMLILGGTYGIVDSSGKSIVHQEYEYAVSIGKPLFACVITEGALEERIKTFGIKVAEIGHQMEMSAFRNQVVTKLTKEWSDDKDIKNIVQGTLRDFEQREGLLGWVKAGTQPNYSKISSELAELLRENRRLRGHIESISNENKFLGLSAEHLWQHLQELDGAVEFIIKHGKGSPFYVVGIGGAAEPIQGILDELSYFEIVEKTFRNEQFFYYLTATGKAFLEKMTFRQ